jgi:hypothetical protein
MWLEERERDLRKLKGKSRWMTKGGSGYDNTLRVETV